MTDNNETLSSGPTDLRSPTHKQHDLKIKKMIALRARLRRQRHCIQIKKRKHAHLIHALQLNALTRTVDTKPAHKINMHSLFYAKPLRDAHLAAMATAQVG